MLTISIFGKYKMAQITTIVTPPGETEQSAEDVEKAEQGVTEILSHWHPNLTLNVVYDHTPWVPGQV